MAKIPKIPKLTEEEIKEEKTKYTRKIVSPIYEPKNEMPQIKDLYDTTKRNELLLEIENDKDLDAELRDFLKSAAERHTSFNFSKIADFYAHLPVKYKKHFENSALVIVDYDNAIRNGFMAYDKEVQLSRIDYLENVITEEKLALNKSEVQEKRLKLHEEERDYLKSVDSDEDDITEEW